MVYWRGGGGVVEGRVLWWWCGWCSGGAGVVV